MQKFTKQGKLVIGATRRQLGLLVCIVFLSLASALIIIVDTSRPDYYLLLPLLPLAFGVVNILFVGILKTIPANIGITMLVILYAFRLVFIPALMTLGGYQSVLKIDIAANAENAIFLMLYELIVVYGVIYVTLRSSNKALNPNLRQTRRYIKLHLFGTILLGIVLFDLLVWIYIPECHQIYRSIFRMGETDFTRASYVIGNEITSGTVKRAALTLFTMTFQIAQIFVPAYFIILINNKCFRSINGIILSIPFVLVPLLFVSATVAQSVICAFLLLLLLARLNPKKRKQILLTSIFLAISFIVFFFLVRFDVGSRYGSDNIWVYFSSVFNAYFSGVDNVAAIFNISKLDKWKSLFFNFYGAIPFNSTLFGLHGDKLQAVYNASNFSYGQIPPAIGAGYYYFGWIGATIFSSIMAYFSVSFGYKAIYSNNMWVYLSYTFIALIMAMGMVMYNETIALSWFTNLIIPMLILSKFSEDNI